MAKESAVIVGVGAGLGWALVEHFAQAGFDVAAAARRTETLEEWKALDKLDNVSCYSCDVTKMEDVKSLFNAVVADQGIPDVVVFNAGNIIVSDFVELAEEDLEYSWQVGCMGGFRVGQEAARAMLERGSGTIIFTGATASLRGGARFVSLAAPKNALRAVAQSMARELGPKGIHVVHTIIDGGITSKRPRVRAESSVKLDTAGIRFREPPGDDSVMQPEAIAETYCYLHRQPRNAWTHELDLRPWVEKF